MRRFLIRGLIILTIAVIAVGVIGCAKEDNERESVRPAKQTHVHEGVKNEDSSSATADSVSTDSEARQVIIINDGLINPPHLSVKPGTTVVWVNNDVKEHEIHADDDSFHSSELQPGQSFSLRIDGPVSIGYHCHIHEGEKGMIMVEGS